jgi:hypothetical protein
MSDSKTIRICATDPSGQKEATWDRAPADTTVGELVERFIPELDLPRNDADGYPVRYTAYVQTADGGGRGLASSDTVGEALPGLGERDRVALLPEVVAG